MTDVKNVVCKMRCTTKKEECWSGSPEHQASTVQLQPVYAENGPNKSWSEATPSGQVELRITNKAAHAAFELGKCYLVTFAQTEE